MTRKAFIGLIAVAALNAAGVPSAKERGCLQSTRPLCRMAGQSWNLELGQRDSGRLESGHFKVNKSIHAVDYSQKEEHLLARSKDGGETWTIEKPLSLLPPPGGKMAGVPTEDGGKEVTDNTTAIDFKNPGFAMTVRMFDKDIGPSRSLLLYDRGKNWRGPYRVPDFGTKGIAAARTISSMAPHDDHVRHRRIGVGP